MEKPADKRELEIKFSNEFSNIKVTSTYENNVLGITVDFSFKPFDITEYQNEFMQQRGGDSDKLKWLYCTIYNYIPIAIIYNTQPGLYGDIESGNWEEVYSGQTLWDNATLKVSDEWENGNLATSDKSNLYINDLRELAETYISNNDEWYKTDMGKTFSFATALNGNVEFSHLNPPTYNGFTETAIRVLTNQSVYDTYNVWHKKNPNASICNVTLTTSIPNVTNNENWTYAVVSADPSSNKILTEFIYVKKEGQEPIDKFKYIADTLEVHGTNNELSASVTQMNDKRVKLRISANSTQWKTLTPQIKFKVKHIKA